MDRVEAAYRRVHPRLWHALVGWTGDPDVASDAEAEAFSQALARGCAIDDVDAWVWRTAFRVAGGLLSQRSRGVAAASGAGSAVDEPQVAEPAGDPALVEFLAQLGGLSTQQRAVVVLRYVGGMRPSEIADVLDTTPGAVRVQLHRAHTHLRTTLREDDHGR